LAVCPVTVDGRELLASGGDDWTVRLWDPVTGEPVAVLHGHQGRIRSVCPVTVDGRHLLASGGDDQTVRLWDPATGEPIRTLHGHQGMIWSVCPVTVDGRHLVASGGDDRTVRIWDPITGQVQALMRVDGPLRACAQISAEGLATGGLRGLYMFDYLPRREGRLAHPSLSEQRQAVSKRVDEAV
jgi:WD40 repeat protein